MSHANTAAQPHALDPAQQGWFAQPFLYQTQVSARARVFVTHNLGCEHDIFAGNLGFHVGDDAQGVLARRHHLESCLGTPIQWLNQTHSTTVCSIEHHAVQASNEQPPTADAVLTQQTGLSLAIMTADCMPVLFSAHNNQGAQAIAAAHAGWRGLAGGILYNTLTKLRGHVPNAHIHAHIGPCIGVGAFEVGDEVKDAFNTLNPRFAALFTHNATPAKYLCDLESIARLMLQEDGVNQISGGGWCTHSDARLASYRRQARTGRFASVIAMV